VPRNFNELRIGRDLFTVRHEPIPEAPYSSRPGRWTPEKRSIPPLPEKFKLM